MARYKEKIVKLSKIINSKRISTIAGSWVFYFMTSIIPLVFLMITAFGVFGVDLKEQVLYRLPNEIKEIGESIYNSATNTSKGITVFFILSVIVSGSTLLNQMSKDGDFMYGLKVSSKRGILRRLKAIAGLGVLFFVFSFSAFLFAFSNSIFSDFSGGKITFLIKEVSMFVFVISISFGLIVLLNRYISPVKLKFSDTGVGSLISLCIIVLGTIGFTLYLRFFNPYSSFYGSMVSVIVFIIWAYILMFGLTIGTALTVTVYKNNRRKISQ